MLPCIVQPTIRSDKAGEGHYGASRGSRDHRGIDLQCVPGEPVRSPVSGSVTKLGYPYGDDLTWRYIEVTDVHKQRHRMFYAKPIAQKGEHVTVGQAVGEAQDISDKYPGQDMKPHVHYEVIDPEGAYIDPQEAIT